MNYTYFAELRFRLEERSIRVIKLHWFNYKIWKIIKEQKAIENVEKSKLREK
jgi:hypothetical protein